MSSDFGNYISILYFRGNTLINWKWGDFVSFGERLRELREENNMTQKQLGELLGVSGRQAGNYESNKQFLPDESSLLKIIKRFDVSADYLFGLTNVRNYKEIFSDFEVYKNLSLESRNQLKGYMNYLATKNWKYY